MANGPNKLNDFSVCNLKYVILSPIKSNPGRDRFCQAYASKEKLYVLQAAFIIPKSSPLKEKWEETLKINNITNKYFLFQKYFQKAISSWLETGIRQKMENEIKTSPTWRGYFDETSFWTRKDAYGNKPLTLIHVLPSFMVLGCGLIPSILISILEILLHMNARRANVKFIPEAQDFGNAAKPLEIMQDMDNKGTIKVMAEIQKDLSLDN